MNEEVSRDMTGEADGMNQRVDSSPYYYIAYFCFCINYDIADWCCGWVRSGAD